MEKEVCTAKKFSNLRGAIHIHGSAVLAGDWKNLSATLNSIYTEGWYSTGMVSEILPVGSTVKPQFKGIRGFF